MDQLISTLDLYFGKKAPQLPAGLKEGIVKIGPYIVVISLILSVLGLLAIIPLILGTSVIFTALGSYGAYGSMTSVVISLIFGVIVTIIYIMAVPGLFKRTSKSWTLVFYALVLSLIHLLISFNLVGFVIAGIIWFYILFQIKPYYFGGVTTAPPAPSAPTQTM